jgi:DNA/RNA endonuclease G (NUC1)
MGAPATGVKLDSAVREICCRHRASRPLGLIHLRRGRRRPRANQDNSAGMLPRRDTTVGSTPLRETVPRAILSLSPRSSCGHCWAGPPAPRNNPQIALPIVNTRLRSRRFRRTVLAALPLCLAALAACSDQNIAGPRAVPGVPDTPDGALQALVCTASVSTRALSCETPPPAGGARTQIVGGQNTNLKLTSSNVSYTPVDSTFSFDVTVQNLMPEKMGTTDGVNAAPAGIRVFFASGPIVTGGSGAAFVANADDQGTFTSTGQNYFQYDEVLATNQVSSSRNWQLHIDPSVSTFSFVVYVAADLQPLLVITELMANPGGTVQDSSGEYVEIYNAGTFPVNMNGMIVNDQSGSGIGGADTIPTDFIIPAKAYRVMGRSTNTSKNGGITVHYNYVHALGGTSTLLQFSNSAADHFRIRKNGVTLDSVGYTNASTATVSGRARELTNVALDNTAIDGSNWAQATANYESSNRGTPGAVNSTSTTLPPAGPAATVTLTPTSLQLAPGNTAQMTATAVDSLGQPTTTTFTWSTLNATVATVNSTGLVTANNAGTTSVIATSANGRADTSTVIVQAVDYLNHVEFGTPTDGTPSNELILTKPQYVLSYGPNRGGPNWVSWNLNITHFGPADRCDCFAADPQLPDSIYHVVTSDYTGSGYSRGHMVMSAQRTATDAENAATFLMTNILPQHQDQNGGPWLRFENYNNELAEDSLKELYIIAGGTYTVSPATLNGAGKVQIPQGHWKIVVILDRGETLANVSSTADIRVIAVLMPNVSGISGNGWEMYKTTVDAIEAATGYDFLAALPDAIEAAVEASIGS